MMKPYADAPRLPDAPSLDPRELFQGVAQPVELELGVGTGAFVIERLEQHPDLCMIGLEVRRKWASIADERLRRRGLGARGRVFAEDARSALPSFVDASIGRVFIHFPDPWWKKRHRKRLLVTSALLAEIARVLEPGGELFIQTDVPDRGELYERLAADQPMLEPGSPREAWRPQTSQTGSPREAPRPLTSQTGSPGTGQTARVEENPYGVRSPRERRAMADGLPIVRLLYRRRLA